MKEKVKEIIKSSWDSGILNAFWETIGKGILGIFLPIIIGILIYGYTKNILIGILTSGICFWIAEKTVFAIEPSGKNDWN